MAGATLGCGYLVALVGNAVALKWHDVVSSSTTLDAFEIGTLPIAALVSCRHQSTPLARHVSAIAIAALAAQ